MNKNVIIGLTLIGISGAASGFLIGRAIYIKGFSDGVQMTSKTFREELTKIQNEIKSKEDKES